ncbi:MAG: PrgI family protein [Candidatus Doudnabacteria bacterium]|nr:PrgI family protein [Candidatus Doudnabacteria bacterium]
MQFAVPQFTDVEDKLIGPLTLKQFFVVLAAGGLCLLFWSLPIPKIGAILIDLPIAILGITLAFASYNGRPMLTYILPFITYMASPKTMVFARETNLANISSAKVVEKVEVEPESSFEAPDSRLRKLAYLLDQKTQEEKELIEKTINR